MDHREIQALIRRSPFEPFVVRMSNGESYEVRHPELVMLTPATLYLFEPASEKVVRCSLFQIATIEHAEPSDAGSSP